MGFWKICKFFLLFQKKSFLMTPSTTTSTSATSANISLLISTNNRHKEWTNFLFIRCHSLKNHIFEINTCFLNTKGRIFCNPEFYFISLIVTLVYFNNRIEPKIRKNFWCESEKISPFRISPDDFYLHNIRNRKWGIWLFWFFLFFLFILSSRNLIWSHLFCHFFFNRSLWKVCWSDSTIKRGENVKFLGINI